MSRFEREVFFFGVGIGLPVRKGPFLLVNGR